MKNYFNFMLVTFLVLSVSTKFLFSQEIKTEQSDEMKIWMDYMTPSEVHKKMAKQVGEWKSVITMWMSPDIEPTKSEGTANSTMILGDRYLQSTFKGNFMGMPMEGFSIDAYDNGKKTYINIWIDNFGTGVLYSEGKWDEKNRMIVYEGQMYDPMAGKDVKVKLTSQEVNDNHYVTEMFQYKDGKEYKSMHIDYYRK